MKVNKCAKRLFLPTLLMCVMTATAVAAVNPTLGQFRGETINTPTAKVVSYSFTIKPTTTVNADTAISIQPNAAHAIQFDSSGTATAANGEELMIRTLDVVNDSRAFGPDGPWSFVHLMKEMMPNPNGNVEAFIRSWLATWNQNQLINGFTVAARNSPTSLDCGGVLPCTNPLIQVTNTNDILLNWPKNSDGSLDLSQAPFRLLAIVNRLDKNTVDSQNKVTSAGEGRFVFGVINQNSQSTQAVLQFTVILEYGLPASNDVQRDEWVREWHDLGLASQTIFGASGAISTSEYLDRLQKLTDRFTSRNANPANPNGTGSALNQLRTNEIDLSVDRIWELREFHLTSGGLQEVVVSQTPDATITSDEFMETPNIINDTFNAYLKSDKNNILSGKYIIPNAFNNHPFLAGSALNDNQIIGNNAPEVAQQRHIVALNTCMGCHGSETRVDRAVLTEKDFLQIRPRKFDVASAISKFLTGADIVDPLDSSITRRFNDLDGRSCVMNNLVTGGAVNCADRFEKVISGFAAARSGAFSAMSIDESTTSTKTSSTSTNGENVMRRTRAD